MSSSLRPWGHRPVEYSGSAARDWGAGRTVGDGGRYTLQRVLREIIGLGFPMKTSRAVLRGRSWFYPRRLTRA